MVTARSTPPSAARSGTSTSARPRSTRAPTRFSTTLSPNASWDCRLTMDFSLSPDQVLIKESVDRFVGDAYGPQKRRDIVAGEDGFSRDYWGTFASLGWLGIALPEAQGGFGGSPVESMILMEAFGRGLVVEPYLPAGVLGGDAVA